MQTVLSIGPSQSLEDNREAIGLIRDIISQGESVKLRVTGVSMSPFLTGGETVTIGKPPPGGLRRGDVVLFPDRQGLPLMHRIIRKTKDTGGTVFVQTKGDAVPVFDEPIAEQDVIGSLRGVQRDTPQTVAQAIFDAGVSRWRIANYFLAGLSLTRAFACSRPVAFLKKLFFGLPPTPPSPS